jgi:hypothetical protein
MEDLSPILTSNRMRDEQGGQAILGGVHEEGAGDEKKLRKQPHEPAIHVA